MMLQSPELKYVAHPYAYARRRTREVMGGNVGVGAHNPIRVQSMTTTRTQDVTATAAQAIALIEAGCEIVRITAPTVQDARAIGESRKIIRAAGFDTPLVADIHFSPEAAMEAANHVEKVRINPGNYADSRKFAVLEYTDAEYAAELDRIRDRFSPLVRRCKELGISMRVGTNHGSLSDRIMNRFGDTPLGMVESALEFLQIARDEGYLDIILSMKASNPKVMIQAYRLLVARMDALGWDYPLHLGVTEAGNGEDGRIKSAVGIGSLLDDGLGDTIRVSLTEDPVAEVPVARRLAAWYSKSSTGQPPGADLPDPRDPYDYARRLSEEMQVGPVKLGAREPVVVMHGSAGVPVSSEAPSADVILVSAGVELSRSSEHTVTAWSNDDRAGGAAPPLRCFASDVVTLPADMLTSRPGLLVYERDDDDFVRAAETLVGWAKQCDAVGHRSMALGFRVRTVGATIRAGRLLAGLLQQTGRAYPIHIVSPYAETFDDLLLASSVALGSLLCDGLGDSVEIRWTDGADAMRLAFNILQAAGVRITKTEFVACPGCGRTLFELEPTTDRIKSRTGHLVGVKIAVMGCIVNGPGEMADADF
ncbi:MAG TPA: (E)-4-hydroxy-3-methylbut-2-enyl-diphosphate synthase, partial [Chloroflexota bacterium]|nr:(E)-4-hydroxy-3-methylbut-2-enyl-diphosphate synthase [Chloroflexota bacterium]